MPRYLHRGTSCYSDVRCGTVRYGTHTFRRTDAVSVAALIMVFSLGADVSHRHYTTHATPPRYQRHPRHLRHDGVMHASTSSTSLLCHSRQHTFTTTLPTSRCITVLSFTSPFHPRHQRTRGVIHLTTPSLRRRSRQLSFTHVIHITPARC